MKKHYWVIMNETMMNKTKKSFYLHATRKQAREQRDRFNIFEAADIGRGKFKLYLMYLQDTPFDDMKEQDEVYTWVDAYKDLKPPYGFFKTGKEALSPMNLWSHKDGDICKFYRKFEEYKKG